MLKEKDVGGFHGKLNAVHSASEALHQLVEA